MQYTDLSMGWCINCHRETKVNIDNKYYANYRHKTQDSRYKTQITVEDIEEAIAGNVIISNEYKT